MDSSSPQREAIRDDDETQGNDDEFGTTSPVTASGNKRKTKSAAAVKKKKITSIRSTGLESLHKTEGESEQMQLQLLR